MQLRAKQSSHPIYYVISDQPDCCGVCGCRLDLREITVVDGERIFVSECFDCHHEVLLVEE